jgi:hypothetical protein
MRSIWQKGDFHKKNCLEFKFILHTWIWIQQLKLMRIHADPNQDLKPCC